jgi:predicted nuclease of restriction endonuclease-like (RecB) superfamily
MKVAATTTKENWSKAQLKLIIQTETQGRTKKNTDRDSEKINRMKTKGLCGCMNVRPLSAPPFGKKPALTIAHGKHGQQ